MVRTSVEFEFAFHNFPRLSLDIEVWGINRHQMLKNAFLGRVPIKLQPRQFPQLNAQGRQPAADPPYSDPGRALFLEGTFVRTSQW